VNPPTSQKPSRTGRRIIFNLAFMAILSGFPPPIQAATIYIVDPTTDARVLPDTLLPETLQSDGLTVTCCRGETESASFVIRNTSPSAALLDVVVSVSNLIKSGGGPTFSKDNVNVRTVKCWWQAGLDINDNEHAQLVPELLLKDDSLVRVIMTPPRNEIKLPSGYLEISNPSGVYISGTLRNSPTTDQMPVYDGSTLQPFSIPASSNMQVYMTIRVSNETAPGTYTGTINISDSAGNPILVSASLGIKLEVPAFNLQPSDKTYSIYHRSRVQSQGMISSDGKSQEQYVAEIRNLAEHGVLSPNVYGQGSDANLVTALFLRRENGIDNSNLFYLGFNIDTYKNNTTALSSATLNLRSLSVSYGVDEVFIHGVDEADPTTHSAQIGAVHDAGGKVFVASNTESKYRNGISAGLDSPVYYSDLTSELVSVGHSNGGPIFSYNAPQGGVEKPETYRRNYGWRLRNQGFDGAMTYAYQAAFGNVWNDFDHVIYRDHNMTYPTADGVIDTVQWEGFREAVDDSRYIATLEHTCAQILVGNATSSSRLAKSALAWLNTTSAARGDLNASRAKMTRYISRLHALPTDPEPRSDGLRGYWSFSGIKSTRYVLDTSGWDNAGTAENMDAELANGSAFSTGKVGRGIVLNSDRSQYVDVGNDDSLNLSHTITVAAWVRASSSTQDSQIIYCRDQIGSRYRLNVSANGRLNLYVRTQAEGWHSGGTGNPHVWTDGWHHVAWTYDSASNMTKFYVDGALDYSSTSASTGPMASAPLTTVRIGGGENSVYFDGSLDEIKIYKYALTDNEILQLYLEHHMRGKWGFNEAPGSQIILDGSGNSNNGLPQSTVSYESRIEGRSGGAIALKAQDQQVFDCGNDLSLDFSDAITLAAWVKLPPSSSGMQVAYCRDQGGSRYLLTVNSSRKLNLWVRTQNQSWHNGGSGQVREWADDWHHIAWTYDGTSNSTKFYVDGEVDFSTDSTNLGPLSNSPLVLFRIGGNENSTYSTGDIDDVRLLSRSLSQLEIQKLITEGSLCGRWNFDEPATDQVSVDTSGNENHGTPRIPVVSGSRIAGKKGGAYKFNRTDQQYFDCGKKASLNMSAAITFMAWVKLESNNADSQIVYCKDTVGSRYRLNITAGGKLNLYVRTQAQGWHVGGTGSSRVWTDGWHHISWTYDGSTNSTKFYVDGELDYANTTISTGPMSNASLSWLRIGGGENSVYCDAAIDNVRLYDSALSQESIQAQMTE